MVGHEHKGEAEQDGGEFPVTNNRFYLVKIAIVNLHSWVANEEFFSLISVLWMKVDSYNFSVVTFQLVNDFF